MRPAAKDNDYARPTAGSAGARFCCFSLNSTERSGRPAGRHVDRANFALAAPNGFGLFVIVMGPLSTQPALATRRRTRSESELNFRSVSPLWSHNGRPGGRCTQTVGLICRRWLSFGVQFANRSAPSLGPRMAGEVKFARFASDIRDDRQLLLARPQSNLLPSSSTWAEGAETSGPACPLISQKTRSMKRR